MSQLGGIGRFAMLAGSLLLGVVAGWSGYRIFLAKVPDAMQTALLNTEVRVYYLGAGLVLGLLIYGWSCAVSWVVSRAAAKAAAPAAPGPVRP